MSVGSLCQAAGAMTLRPRGGAACSAWAPSPAAPTHSPETSLAHSHVSLMPGSKKAT